MRKPWDAPSPVRVEIATNDRTQPPLWTDISAYAKGGAGVTVSRTPRSGPFQKTPPNRLSLSVDNSTGQFSDLVGFAPTLFQKRLRVVVRASEAPGNFVTNSTFETDTSGWTTFGSGVTISRNNDVTAQDGAWELKVVYTNAITGTVTTVPGLTAGRMYTVSAYVYNPVGNSSVAITVVGIGTSARTNLNAQWQRLSYTFFATGTSHDVQLGCIGTSGTKTFYVDAVQVDEGGLRDFATSFPLSYRFTGDISGNSVGFPARGRAVTPITAVDRSARLASRTRTFRSVPVEEPLSDSPYVFYPLSEPASSVSAGDLGPNQQPPLTVGGTGTALTFGSTQLVTTSDDTGASFTAGKYLINALPLGGIGGASNVSFGAVLRTSVSAAQTVVALHDQYGPRFRLSTTATGTVKFDWADPFDTSGTPRPTISSTATVNDGQPHHLALTAVLSGGTVTFRLYVDGNLEATSSPVTASLLPFFVRMAVGGSKNYPGITGTVGLVGAWATALSGAQISEHSAAALNGFTGEATYARLIRYCRWAGIAQSEIVLDATASYAGLMSHVDSEDVAPWDMMALCETVEGGLLNVDGAGNIRFRSRGSFYNQPAWATLTADYTNGGAAATLESSLEFPTDTANVVNDLEGTRPGGATQRVINSTSINAYQRADDQVTIPASTDDAVADALEWRVAILSNPKPAADGVAVRLTGPTITDAHTAQVLALEPGARVDLTNLPPQAPASTVSYEIEGWEERYSHSDGALWTATTGPLAPAVWTVEDPVYGTLDGPGVLAY